MKYEKENMQGKHNGTSDGDEAYQTLINWVKSVPNTIKEIEENGTEDDLVRYKKQIKMVVDKLKEIEQKLKR